MAANSLLGLLPFGPGALGIAQPPCRRTGIASLRRATMRGAQVASSTHDQSRAKLAVAVSRYHVCGVAFCDEDALKVQPCQSVEYRKTLGLLRLTPYLLKEPADGKSIKENQLVVY